MKFKSILTLIFSTLLLAGCSEDQVLGTFGDLNLSTTYISIPAEGGDVKAAAPKSPAELVPSISKERDWFLPLVIKIFASSWVLSFSLTSLKLMLVYFSARSRPMDAYVFCTSCSLYTS